MLESKSGRGLHPEPLQLADGAATTSSSRSASSWAGRRQAAEEFPDTNFAIIDFGTAARAARSRPWSSRTSRGSLFKEQEVGYLAGYLAALEDEDRHVVSTVGGQKIPPVDRFIAGFKAGAKAADPKVKDAERLLAGLRRPGEVQGARAQPDLEESDVVFQVAGGCGLGALDAAKEKGLWGIGVDADQALPGRLHPDERDEEGRRGRVRHDQAGRDGDVQGRRRQRLRPRRGRVGSGEFNTDVTEADKTEARRDHAADHVGVDHPRRTPFRDRIGRGAGRPRPAPVCTKPPTHRCSSSRITKRFRDLVANDSVDLDRPGRGARAAGRERRRQVDADERPLRAVPPGRRRDPVRGKPLRMRSPRDAIDAGIGMVHQHFMLIPVMTVTENIVLAAEPREGPLLDHSKAQESVRDLSRALRPGGRPDARVESISVAQQQRVEILKALYRNAGSSSSTSRRRC